MIELKETHNKIIKILETKGPSLPISIAKEMNMSSLFISAFLAELVSEKKIKISNLKVGGTPLYFLEGQEKNLENFSNYLHPKENEAFLLLKKKKVLKDSEQEPAIRVALRSIKDFAIPFKKDEEIYWRYVLISEKEALNFLEPKKEIKPLETKATTEKLISVSEEIKNEFENPLIIKEKKKIKPKSDFVLNVISFINRKNFKIIEEKDYKAKEYNCILQIRSELGPIDFLCQAKDKKKISETDLKKLLSTAQKIPLPALLIYNNDLSKKALEYCKKYRSILKAIKLE